jgi:hypothetical protein
MNRLDVTKDSAQAPESSELRLTPNLARPTHGWLPIVESCVLAALLATFVGGTFFPAWRSLNTDFPNYYLAASLYHRHIPLDRIYEWTWFQRQNDHLGVRDGLVSFAPNPPMCAVPILPLTGLTPLAAKRVWLIVNLGFLALALWMLHCVTSLSWRQLILISLLCIVPLRANFLFGQYYVLILLLICGAYYASCLGRRFTAGGVLAAAATLKLFPVLFLIPFVWKRNWRSAAGLIVGAAVLAAVSVGMFGLDVHRVFLSEVMSQVPRGDWLDPYYYLQRSSFATLWSHLFLFEPELNASPLLNSPWLYAFAQAVTVVIVLLGFLLSIGKSSTKRAVALDWAALVPLSLLLSSQSGIYHPSVLIFTAIVGFDALTESDRKSKALFFLALYVIACAPLPGILLNLFPVARLMSTTALYLILLSAAWAGSESHFGRRWLAAGLILGVMFVALNLRSVRNRAEDFSRRLPSPPNGYRSASPVPIADGVALIQMQAKRYGAVFLQAGDFHDLELPGDVLSIAGAETIPALYAELAGRQSSIVRVPVERFGLVADTLAEGQEPSLSPNGKWLAFIREEQGRSAVWLSETDSKDPPQMVLADTYNPVDASVTSEGDVIMAAGAVSDPRLFLVKRGTEEVAPLPAFPHPARYPSISPDGKRLAFSRRDQGSWHLVVRELETGIEQQLTHASCNAISPVWETAQTLLYATDCGRGVGLSAIARVSLPR